MSLLDDDIELFDETDIFKGFPNKEDYIYETGKVRGISTISDTIEKIYYDCDVPFFKEKWFMPYGLRIGAYSYTTDFILKISSINSTNIRGIYLDEQIGSIPYEYKNEIPSVLYEFIEKIKSNIFEFADILEHSYAISFKLKDFFGIENYDSIRFYKL